MVVGDFNGDGRDDLVCNKPSTGERWLGYSNGSGSFSTGHQYQNIGWCKNGTLFAGNFNGVDSDGKRRADLMCKSGGNYWFDITDTSNRIGATLSQASDTTFFNNWCSHSGSSVFIGDFDGDGRADLLCHDGAGKKWTTLSSTRVSAAYQFSGTSRYVPMGWCKYEELYVGRFDGRGVDDLFCHSWRTGQRWLAFQFLGNEE